jgi:hypothetical protein
MSEERTMQEVLQEAQQAEQRGIAVDWKAMCFQVLTVATQEIARLQPEAEKQEVPEQAED